MSLAESDIHIWFARMPIELIETEPLQILDKEELQRYESYKTPGKQQEFLFGRFFLKKILSKYLNKAPKEITFSINKHKRPYLSDENLQVNLSHSFGGFAIILSSTHKVGIDIEYLRRNISIEDGRHVFMPDEIAIMRSKDPGPAKADFLERWTLKEAVYKAANQGPQLLFNEFGVNLRDFSLVTESPLLPAIPRQLNVFPVMEDYLLAYAIENPREEVLSPQFFHWQPQLV